jgi:hypothetical protein
VSAHDTVTSASYSGVAFIAMLSSCAGPTTPFGVPEGAPPELRAKIPPHSKKFLAKVVPASLTSAEIRLRPDRQVLHEKSDLEISIHDPLGVPDEHRIQLFYNGFDVTNAFLEGAERSYSANGTGLDVHISSLRLSARREHGIEVRYLRRGRWLSATTFLEAPECPLNDSIPIRTTGRFRPPGSWLKKINDTARKESINPSLLTGLIAQESGFNPMALSPAKALGLTQVTPLADSDLTKLHPDWPRNEAIDDMPVAILRALISSGRLSAKNDWRLDPSRSIQGGVSYLNMLERFWRSEQNEARIRENFEDFDAALSEIVLASYNSGPSRVGNALQQMGPWYLDAPDLKAARQYVRYIASYCYHFAHGGIDYEDPT